MECTFGWCKSSLQEWFELVLWILHKKLISYHRGFLKTKGHLWQRQHVAAWVAKHNRDGNLQSFVDKVQHQNKKLRESRNPESIDIGQFFGSLFAVDGTYSVRTATSDKQLTDWGESRETDRMWTDYKKIHGYKLIVAMSHGLEGSPKYILKLVYGCARPSDASVYNIMVPELIEDVIPQAAGLGDAAFHAAKLIIAPYTSLETGPQQSREKQKNRKAFNHDHSSDRMVSEHGMRYIKLWGAVRGRDDTNLFNNDDTVKRVFEVVWGLHNYIADDCPVF
jgi:hypothetical protein